MKRNVVLQQGTGQPPEAGRYWTSKGLMTWDEAVDSIMDRSREWAKKQTSPIAMSMEESPTQPGDGVVFAWRYSGDPDGEEEAPAWWLGPLPHRFEHAEEAK